MLAVIFAFLQSVTTLHAASLECQVREKGTGRALPRVEVRLSEDIFFTDPQGNIVLNITDDTLSILFAKASFDKAVLPITELKDPCVVYLMPGPPDDNEVIIKGTKRKEITNKSISAEETRRIAPGGDPVQITKILPGVQTQTFQQNLLIRGSGPNDSRYFVDDLRVNNIFHPIGNISIIPDLVVDQVDFSSGGFSSRYGNALGGIVALKTTQEIPKYTKYEFRLNIPFLITYFQERPLAENKSLTTSLRHSLTQFFVPQLLEKFAEDEQSIYAVPRFSDAYVRYLVKHDSGHWKTSLILSHDGFNAAFPSDEFVDEQGKLSIESDRYFGVLGSEALYRLGSGKKLVSTPQVLFTQQNSYIADFQLEIESVQVFIPTELEFRLGKRRYLYLGLEPIWSDSNVDITAPNISQEDPFSDPAEAVALTARGRFITKSLATWVGLEYEVEKWRFSPGVHAFQSGLLQARAIDPRLSVFYQWHPKVEFKASVGQYSMEPEIREASKEFGNPDIGFEVANHYILGVAGKISDRWEYDIQAFKKRTYHLVRLDPITDEFQADGTLLVSGAEFFLRRNMTAKTFGWLSYTYTDGKERRNDQAPLYTSPYNQSHIFQLAAAYKWNAKWEFGTRIKVASGRAYTPVTGARYNANIDKFTPLFNQDEAYSQNYPTYDQSDLFASYQNFYNSWVLVHRFGIQFISVKTEVNSVDYSYDYSEKKLASSNLPPIPYYEIKGRF